MNKKANRIAAFPKIGFSLPVRNSWSVLFIWLLVLGWMSLIFSASSDTRSFEHSSRIVVPLVRLFFPHASAGTLDAAILCARKAAHFTAYAVLALLLWHALRNIGTGAELRLNSLFWKCLVLCVVYAASDEFHQRFVPTREASVADVAIDGAGALLMLLLLRSLALRRKKPAPAEH